MNLQHLTFSSDANASLPMFDAQNNFVGLGEGRIASLYEEMTDAIRLGVPVQDARWVVTSNPARILKLPHKGQLQLGADADLLLIDKTYFRVKGGDGKRPLVVFRWPCCCRAQQLIFLS